MIIIYCHTSPSGKRYVGQTKRTMAKRWASHVYDATHPCGQCPTFYRAIRKYGAAAFAHEVLETVETREAANEAEARWIAKLGTRAPAGYNLSAGGDAADPHPETIARMCAAATAREASKTPEERSARARRAMAARPPEYRSDIARRINAVHSPAERSGFALAREAAYTPEQKAANIEAMKRGHAARSDVERSDAARRGRAAMTPGRRSEIARKANVGRSKEQQATARAAAWAKVSPEQRAEIQRKGWETRRARAVNDLADCSSFADTAR